MISNTVLMTARSGSGYAQLQAVSLHHDTIQSQGGIWNPTKTTASVLMALDLREAKLSELHFVF